MVALVATLAALVGAGLLVQAALRERRRHLYLWAATVSVLGLSLASAGVGMLGGFGSPTFRAMQITGALLAPVTLGIGLVELVSQRVQSRFAARLAGVSFTLIAVVVLAWDPIKGKFGDQVPKASDYYGALPTGLLNAAHFVVITGMLAGVALVAGRKDEESRALLMPVGVLTGAALANIVGIGYLPGLLKIVSLAAAAGMVWYAADQTVPAHDEEDEKAEAGMDHPQHRRDPRAEHGQPAPDPQRPPRARPRPPQPPASGAHALPPSTGGQALPPQNTGSRPLPRPGAHAAPRSGGYPQPPTGGYPAPNGTGPYPNGNGQTGAGTGPYQAPNGTGGLQKAPIVGDDWFAAPAPAPAQRPPAGGPHGQIVVYTLLDGREQAFDRLANDLARAATQNEPDIMIYTFHEVDGAPTQRISYQLFSDREAFDDHQRHPYVARFQAESRTHVLATNVIDLKLTGGSLPFLQAPR